VFSLPVFPALLALRLSTKLRAKSMPRRQFVTTSNEQKAQAIAGLQALRQKRIASMVGPNIGCETGVCWGFVDLLISDSAN
jgi:hypothetical protein